MAVEKEGFTLLIKRNTSRETLTCFERIRKNVSHVGCIEETRFSSQIDHESYRGRIDSKPLRLVASFKIENRRYISFGVIDETSVDFAPEFRNANNRRRVIDGVTISGDITVEMSPIETSIARGIADGRIHRHPRFDIDSIPRIGNDVSRSVAWDAVRL